MEHKKCKNCGETKPANRSSFAPHATNKDGLTGKCRVCLAARRREVYHKDPSKQKERTLKYYHANKEKVDDSLKKYNQKPTTGYKKFVASLMRQFSITVDEYAKMFDKQKGACKICSSPLICFDGTKRDSERPTVDHCHETGKVRGLLCHKCNSGLGLFNDNPELLQRAINYINDTKEEH